MRELSDLETHLLRRANLSDYVKRSAQIYPGDVAMVCGDREVTFAELNDKVNQVANALLQLGVKRGDRISVISHPCLEYIFIWFGLMKIGGVLNPINVMLKGGEIEYILNHAEPKILVVEDALTPNVDEVKGQIKSVQKFLSIDLTGSAVGEGWEDIGVVIDADVSLEEPLVIAGDNDPATLIYTSGTEARPKGVMGSHLNMYMTTMHLVSDLEIGKKEALLLVAPLYHVAGIVLCLTSIYMGAKIVIDTFPDPVNIMEFTSKHEVTIWTFPPAMLALFPSLPGFSKEIVKSVKMIIAFGSALPKAIAEVWKGILPDVKMINYYGQTESGPLGTCSSGEDIIAHPGSIGKPHRLVEVKIFDDEEKEVDTGEVGEIVMRGPTIMIGYFKDEERTAETLRHGWLHTNDLARRDEDGFFHFVDRKKDIIVTGSENVSSLEIEQFLFSHEKVQDAAVVGLPHPRWGEAVVAVVVPRPEQEISEKEIIAYCKEKIAGYKVPKKVVVLNEIPRNPAGKSLKHMLRKQLSEQLTLEA
ncbi:MAG: AMP-binding protein [Actinomycetota bacterium]|nr:AMP-binding protein [Actinomycetota bacterium]MDD5668260.1 AMP-binding protein [Actinomycetota bacterium]